MLTLKNFVPLSKCSSSIFSRKISFYPMPEAASLKISGAKLELFTIRYFKTFSPSEEKVTIPNPGPANKTRCYPPMSVR